ncbi:hypothetical protein O0880_09140 [Janthinobacterium sp. SUN118]|uniref:hypothetical protein n=1 Tax=Janthinobacterium sp. SUN118 TaxID=3004100 RepID=UPI0025B22AD2|nr:hypothetical protein [Janthinobacterium sp. SUN118]MDN2709582.1 hypothetical protein [Janthinobacterium sp. SUN118]
MMPSSRRAPGVSGLPRGCPLFACLMFVVLLSGCAAGPAAPEPWPVAQPCITSRPVAPALPPVPARGIFAQVQALLAREHLHAAYARQLEALLDACASN